MLSTGSSMRDAGVDPGERAGFLYLEAPERSLIPVLVTGIQPACVRKPRSVFRAADAALLDDLHEAGHEGERAHVPS